MATSLSINKLKELVSTAEDLDSAINYFFDMEDANLLPDVSIIEIESTDIQLLLKTINEVISKHFKLNIKVGDVMLRQTIDKQIVHGLCFLSGAIPKPLNPISIIYMCDLKIAIVFIYHNGKTEMWRLRFKDDSFQITYH